MDEINFSLLRKHGITRAIRKALSENRKIDNHYFRGLGKGNWALTLIQADKNRLKITSVDSEEILYDFLSKVIPDQEFKLKIDSFMCFFNKSKKEEKKTLRGLLVKLDSKLGVESKQTEEDTSIKIKSLLSGSKDKVIETLELLLKLHKLTHPYEEDTKIKIENNNVSILIQIGNTILIKSNINEKKIIKVLNSLFAADNKEAPSTYHFYVKIENIKGGWTKGKREGCLVQELKDKQKEKIKQLKL